MARDIGLTYRTLGAASRAHAAGNGRPATAADLAPTLLAGLATVLRRHEDLAEVAIRFTRGAERDPIALRLEVGGEPTFAELVARAESALTEAERGDAVLAEPSDALEAGPVLGLDAEPDADARFDLWLTAQTGPDGLELKLHYDSSRHEPAAAEELLGHLESVLEAASTDPDRSILALPVLTEPERTRLLDEWNETSADYPARCLHELVSEQARLAPDRVAVSYEQESLSYAELETRANQVAHHLRGLGVGADMLVGICVERSIEMVVGLLGILKAGGAYVPVDPAYPADRQEYMLSDAQARIVVTQERLIGGLATQEGVQVVCLDRDWPAIARSPGEQPPPSTSDPEQLAYVIYTSGSTGRPKGVQIPHRALVNFLTTMRSRPGLHGDDTLVAVTTLSFDIAGLELYLPLTVGAHVVIASAATAADARALGELLDRSAATVMQATPTTWRMLIDSGWSGRPGMKALCGGEALPAVLGDRLVALGLELWNMYGPTETTIWSTVSRVGQSGRQTIGRPIGNTTIYILDGRLEPVPVGVVGELYIGGDGLARGYRGRPDLTSERFLGHPFDPTPGARIYRTGDLARYRRDGNIEFLGRVDHQVKVRGFRIELGEIETTLARHPGVADAVVIAREPAGGAAELAAYVIPRGVPVGMGQLRRFLAESLPAYMVPSTVTALTAFPLTPNGKVDRKALPEPTRERSDEGELVEPRTELERRLALIWARELEISRVGVTDNFFDLGVTSIVAASLFAQIERDLGGRLPLGAIFQAPTIESLARLIEGGSDASRWTSLVPIQPLGSQPPIFVVHGGAGTILHLAALARRLGSDQPFYGLQSKGLYGGTSPIPTVEGMATHYLSEMRQVHDGGPWRLGGYCFGSIVAFEIAQRLVAAGEQVEMLSVFNGPSPSWIRQWGWFGNQPSRRKLRPRTPRITKKQKLARALREPRRFVSGLAWHAARATDGVRARVALRLGRPLPERLREQYFLDLHQVAERAYDARPYQGEMQVFFGEGLYEDPELGWGGLAEGGVETHAVPGEHDNNRQAMMEPAVGFVAQKIEERLARSSAGDVTDGPRESAAPDPVRAAMQSMKMLQQPVSAPRPSSRAGQVRSAVEWHLRRRLPRPAYNSAVGAYNEARRLVGRSPGRGRLLPDYVIIGAAKAGTTSLYGWLCEHPFTAAASQKEVHYFDYNHYRGEDWYRTHFPLETERAEFAREHGRPFLTGEASPSYISHHWAPERLARTLPNAKLLVALRDPVDRAFSQFQMSRREGEEEHESFERAVAVEDARLDPERARALADPRYNSWPIGCWSYLMRSRYAEQLERWFEFFPREQFHFLTLEDLAAEPQQTLDAVHEFLGLPPHRYDHLHRLHTAQYDPLPSQTRADLGEYFRPHNERLYELLGVDFGWKS